LWDVASSSEIAVLAGTEEQPLDEAYSVAFSPDGSLLASGHADGQIASWDVGTKTLKTIVGPLVGDMVDLAFSPDGSLLASASSQNAVQLWDGGAGTQIATTVGHTNYVSTVAFSPDSAALAIAEWDENIWLWNTAIRQELNATMPIPEVSYTGLRNDTMLTYAPDGSIIATTDGFDVILLEAVTGIEIGRLDYEGSLMSLAFSPDSTLMAVASSQGLLLFNVSTGERLGFFPSNDWLNMVVFSPDQTMIATAGKDHTARVYGLP
jgi:WD40 repeat protein